MAPPFKRIDIACAVGLLLAAFALSYGYLSKHGLGEFYQSHFTPAVMLACTGKFQSLSPAAHSENPELNEFLQRRADTFACSTLSRREFPGWPLEDMARVHLYAYALVGLIWAAFGVSWSALIGLAAVFAAAFASLVYGIARLFVPIPLAVLVVPAAMLSPLHAYMLPDLRDYSKAPFMLAVVFLAGCLVTADNSWRRRFAIAGLTGVVAGIGAGFRSDVFLTVPFFFLVNLLLVREVRLRTLSRVAANFAIFLLGFAAAFFPVLSTYHTQGGVVGHVTLLGLTQPFNPMLGLSFPVYDIGHRYNDGQIIQFVHAFASRFAGGAVPSYGSPSVPYEQYAFRALYEFAWHFPADVIVRVYGSILRVLNLEFFDFSPDSASFPRSVLQLRSLLVQPSIGAALAAASAIYLLAVAPSRAAFFCLFMLFFAGSGAIQFHTRHLFYLEFVYWLSAAIVIYALFRQMRTLALEAPRLRAHGRDFGRHVMRVAAISGAFLGLAGATLAAARAYQQAHVTRLFESYLAVARAAVAATEQEIGDDLAIRPTTPERNLALASKIDRKVAWTYYVATLDAAQCSGEIFWARVVYRASDPHWDMSREITVPLSGAHSSAYLFMPVFQDTDTAFDAILVRPGQRRCLQRLEAIAPDTSLPLPLWLQLSPDWRSRPLYQTLAGRTPVSTPRDLLMQRDEYVAILPLGEGAWQSMDASARAVSDGLRVQGKPLHPRGYAAVSRRYALRKGAVVAATGRIRRGGILLGLLDDREQLANAVEIQPSAFIAAVQAPADGEYRVVVANRLPGNLSVNNVEVKQIGFAALGSSGAWPIGR